MRFCESFDCDKHMSELQNMVSDSINFAVEHTIDDKAAISEIYRIVVDEMFEHHINTASRNGRLTPDNLYPTEGERRQFADVVLRNFIPFGLVDNEISFTDLNKKRGEIRECLKEFQDNRIKSENSSNNKNK